MGRYSQLRFSVVFARRSGAEGRRLDSDRNRHQRAGAFHANALRCPRTRKTRLSSGLRLSRLATAYELWDGGTHPPDARLPALYRGEHRIWLHSGPKSFQYLVPHSVDHHHGRRRNGGGVGGLAFHPDHHEGRNGSPRQRCARIGEPRLIACGR